MNIKFSKLTHAMAQTSVSLSVCNKVIVSTLLRQFGDLVLTYSYKIPIIICCSALLFRSESDLETRYNVCGIICHLAGNNEANWTLTQPTRQEALSKVVTQ